MRKILGLMMGLATVLSSAAAVSEPLLWAGCGITQKAFMAELAAAYQKKYGTEIVLEGGGATKGIRRISDQSVQIGGTCRTKLPGEEQEAQAELNPVAWDALVVIVHKDNPVSDISLPQLRDLYDGKITNWKQLGGPDRPITLMVRKGKISGVGKSMRELVFNNADHDYVTSHIYPSTGPLEKAIEADISAVGVTGISSARKRDVKILSLEGKEPTYENVKSGDYLLYRPLYIAYNPSDPRRDEVKRFIDFAHSRAGREIIRKQGTVPYLEALGLVTKQREQWQAAHTSQ